MSGDHGPNGAYSEVFEEGSDSRPLQTVHRIRANSTIMQLKKILGVSPCYSIASSSYSPSLPLPLPQ